MDNASKALIMAGAILISVAIVGIGIYIFTTANALTDDAVGQIDALAVSAVNSRLEEYFGNNVRGSSVQQLFRDVDVLNAQNALPDKVTFTGKYSTSDNIKSNGRYKVGVATENGKNSAGYIIKISIDDSTPAA